MSKILLLIFLAIPANMLSFMALAFSAGGYVSPNSSLQFVKLCKIYRQVANALLNLHFFFLPACALVAIGLFLWKSHGAGLLVAKVSYALPVVSILCIVSFFIASAIVGA